MIKMFWGKYTCPTCGKHNWVFSPRGFNTLTICLDEEAKKYHVYGKKAPKKFYRGFQGSIICKKCWYEFSIDESERWM